VDARMQCPEAQHILAVGRHPESIKGKCWPRPGFTCSRTYAHSDRACCLRDPPTCCQHHHFESATQTSIRFRIRCIPTFYKLLSESKPLDGSGARYAVVVFNATDDVTLMTGSENYIEDATII
jgi:hypothetical protein